MHCAIFDMDGLLIDSEPLWREAEIEVFGSVGLRLTESLCRETIGLRVDEAIRHWYTRFPWPGPSCEAVQMRLVEVATRLIVERGSLMAGAQEVISELHSNQVKLAVASSSPLALIRTVVEKFGIAGYFAVLHSAEHEPAGKPDPAVYRTTIERLDAEPRLCLAFEDSVAGVQAAKAAGATVIAVPAPEDAARPEFALADVVLTSLSEFSLDLARPGSAPGTMGGGAKRLR